MIHVSIWLKDHMLSSQYFAIEIVDKDLRERQEKLDLQQITTLSARKKELRLSASYVSPPESSGKCISDITKVFAVDLS